MKIDYAIIGSDLNPLYLDFWPTVSKVWKKIFNITPVLGLICDENSDFIEDEFGLVKKFKSIGEIDEGFQSQIIRHWLPKELNGNIIISDIDIVPLSRQYFIDQVNNFDDEKFYIMSSDHFECNRNREIPMCYNIANSNFYAEVLELDRSWPEFCLKLNEMKLGWTTDQKFLWLKVQSQLYRNPEKIVSLNRGWSNYANNRIDRLFWNYEPSLVKAGYYIDSHLLRPYSLYKNQVDDLINLLF